jgi:sugar phosphate isomerase/epimerase
LGIGRGVLEVEKIFNAIVDSGFEGPWWVCDAIPMGPVVWEDAYTGVFRIREMLNKRFGQAKKTMPFLYPAIFAFRI